MTRRSIQFLVDHYCRDPQDVNTIDWKEAALDADRYVGKGYYVLWIALNGQCSFVGEPGMAEPWRHEPDDGTRHKSMSEIFQ